MRRFLIVIGIIFFVLLVCALLSVSGIKRLSAFENALQATAPSTDEDDFQWREECLNKVEAYIQSNRLSLGILQYERTSSLIRVRFCAGLTHIYQPVAIGMDNLSQ